MVGWEGKIIEEAPKSERKARKGDGWGGGGLRKDELITYLKKMGARRCLRDARRTGPLLCGINC